MPFSKRSVFDSSSGIRLRPNLASSINQEEYCSTVIAPCTKFWNSMARICLCALGKKRPLNSSTNLSQGITALCPNSIPKSSFLDFHHLAASSVILSPVYLTFCSSVQPSVSCNSWISVIQSSATNGHCVPSNRRN